MSDQTRAIPLPENIRELAYERLMGDRDQPPLWKGSFWNDEVATESLGYGPKIALPQRNALNAACLVSRVNNLPTRKAVEAAAEFRPEARPLLELWRSIWNRSFPGWDEREDIIDRGNEAPRSESALKRFEQLLSLTEEVAEEPRHVRRRDQANEASRATALRRNIESWMKIDEATTLQVKEPRDYRLHIIDDAETVVSYRDLHPGFGTVSHNGRLYRLAGHDEDGLPTFVRSDRSGGWESKRMSDHPEYWFWPRFQKYMKRRSVFAPNVRIAGAVLADMAAQGHTHAFAKASSCKQGTWTVNLHGIRTIKDALTRLDHTTGKSWESSGLIVQEHLPFSHEQRFFVVDGKVVASVASDRNFCVSDAYRRRLDERLAVLLVPEVDQGVYDRGVTSNVVDRATAAKFARTARAIARDLQEDGYFDYVIDLGLTSRGVAAVEINTFHYAGPYCLERRWIAKAYERRRVKLQRELNDHVKSAIAHKEMNADIVKMADKYRTVQFINDAFAAGVAERNVEDIADVSERIADRLLVKAVIGSKLKTEMAHGK